MKKQFMHKASGMTGQMIYEPRGDRALIGIEHCGEREEAIVSGPAQLFACDAFHDRNIDAYIALWRVNRMAEARAA